MRLISHYASRVWLAISLPTTMLHELTHWLVGLPWADESAIFYETDGYGFGHGVNWGDDVPTWAPIVTSLAPTLLGALVGLIGLWRLFVAPPDGFTELATAAIASLYWGIYCLPQGDDLDIYSNDGDTMQNNTQTQTETEQ
jgi:hypothetical protein